MTGVPTRTIEKILTEVAEQAIEGTLTDETRIGVYELALTVAANELHRIERTHNGAVSPESLLLLQQLALLADKNVTREKILGSIETLVGKNGVAEEDSGGSIIDVSEVRGD